MRKFVCLARACASNHAEMVQTPKATSLFVKAIETESTSICTHMHEHIIMLVHAPAVMPPAIVTLMGRAPVNPRLSQALWSKKMNCTPGWNDRYDVMGEWSRYQAYIETAKSSSL
jgi:hypothetical protein